MIFLSFVNQDSLASLRSITNPRISLGKREQSRGKRQVRRRARHHRCRGIRRPKAIRTPLKSTRRTSSALSKRFTIAYAALPRAPSTLPHSSHDDSTPRFPTCKCRKLRASEIRRERKRTRTATKKKRKIRKRKRKRKKKEKKTSKREFTLRFASLIPSLHHYIIILLCHRFCCFSQRFRLTFSLQTARERPISAPHSRQTSNAAPVTAYS